MAAFRIEKSRLINASPKEVWDALLDVKSWPAWKPFITSTSCSEQGLAVGSKFRMNIIVKGKLPTPVPVKVIEIDEWKRIAWTGGLPGLVMSVHSFILEDQSGKTKVTSLEEFQGLLVKLMLVFVKESDLALLHERWLEAIAGRMEKK